MAGRVLVVDDSATVRRVARRTLERAGLETFEASEGREALEKVQRHLPDVVLVDYALPHMNGLELCEAMKSVANLSDVPVILMSARPEHLSDEVLDQTGAVDAITKPFGPEALLAVTMNALRRRTERPTAPGAEPAMTTDVENAEELATKVALRRGSQALADALGDPLRSIGGTIADATDAQVAAVLADRIELSVLRDLHAALGEALGSDGGEISFFGRSDHVPLGELLQMLQHQQQTGVLDVRRGERAIAICLRGGMVDIALGRVGEREFLLGRYLVEEELIEREELDQLLKRRGGERHLLGAQLVKLGYIGAEDLKRALVRQSSELIYEALRWPSATYRFERFATRPEASDARLGLPMSSILMEGLRRVDEWRLIEEQIHDFELVLSVRRDAVESARIEEELSSDERRVLESIDGQRTVREIVEHSRMGSFEACKILFQLVTAGLIRRRD